MLNRIERIIGHNVDELSSIYLWGSRAFGTSTYQSDYDIICVGPTLETGKEYRVGDLNVHTYSDADWQEKLLAHDVCAVECLMLPNEFILLNRKQWVFVLDTTKLRHVWSAKISNSWVKAKKKLTVAGEPYIGLKSLFHALRMTIFATQLATKGKIDFQSANQHWYDILELRNNNENGQDWQLYKEKYQPIYNALMSRFREVAEK